MYASIQYNHDLFLPSNIFLERPLDGTITASQTVPRASEHQSDNMHLHHELPRTHGFSQASHFHTLVRNSTLLIQELRKSANNVERHERDKREQRARHERERRDIEERERLERDTRERFERERREREERERIEKEERERFERGQRERREKEERERVEKEACEKREREEKERQEKEVCAIP